MIHKAICLSEDGRVLGCGDVLSRNTLAGIIEACAARAVTAVADYELVELTEVSWHLRHKATGHEFARIWMTEDSRTDSDE